MSTDLLPIDSLMASARDASRMLGISRSHAYELIARGDLPSVRLGRRVLVPIEALRTLAGGELHRGWPWMK